MLDARTAPEFKNTTSICKEHDIQDGIEMKASVVVKDRACARIRHTHLHKAPKLTNMKRPTVHQDPPTSVAYSQAGFAQYYC